MTSFVEQSMFTWNYIYKLKIITPKNTKHNKISKHRDYLVAGELPGGRGVSSPGLSHVTTLFQLQRLSTSDITHRSQCITIR